MLLLESILALVTIAPPIWGRRLGGLRQLPVSLSYLLPFVAESCVLGFTGQGLCFLGLTQELFPPLIVGHPATLPSFETICNQLEN
jgi:hypothetical protein